MLEIERYDGCGIAYDSRNWFSEESRFALRKHRLIRKLGNHAEAIFAGNVTRGKNPVNTGMRPSIGFQIAKCEFRAMMR